MTKFVTKIIGQYNLSGYYGYLEEETFPQIYNFEYKQNAISNAFIFSEIYNQLIQQKSVILINPELEIRN